ncbi:MAG TPA: hypothetical protein VMV46_02625 [Thermoanaerobaculia bacterium]|nr:hypothetical protein [Thermoanaerobaculia bacterium]
MGRRPGRSLAALALGSAAVLGLYTAVGGAPQPRVVDEWSYLLAADTFAHNRLTNPPHPMWRHFEADHVLQQPTYASKYPPAQGFVLAVGKVAFGHPAAGLWLSAGLLVAAVGWMLLGWVPPPWAILGAFVVALRLGAGGYWNHTYWGGSVAAIGGALLFGATRRLFRRVGVVDSLLLALGIAILATSRPYEGLLVSLPVAALVVAGLLIGRLRPRPWLRLALPVGVVVAATLSGIATLNHAITGDPLEFPHSLYDRTHRVPPVFLWQPEEARAALAGGRTDAATLPPALEETPPEERSRASAESLSPTETPGARTGASAETGWRAPRTSGWHRLAVTLYFLVGLPAILALVLTPALWRDPWSRFAALAFLAVSVGHFLIYPWWPHYSAPALAPLLVIALQGHRHLYTARRAASREPRAFGRALFGAACLIQIVLFLVQIPAHRADPSDPSRQRARLAWEFERREGRHLLLVTYPPGRNADWTYNAADIDAAKVIWANDLGETANADLLRYYGDRTVWAIDAAFTAIDPVPRLLRAAEAAADGPSGF